MSAKTKYAHPTDVVFAASAAAALENNMMYIKSVSEDVPNLRTNRSIMFDYLQDQTKLTAEHLELGSQIRRYYQAFSLKFLADKPVGEFNSAAMKIASSDVVTNDYEIAVICSLPASYHKNVERDNVETRIKFARGGYIGEVGESVETEVEIVKRIWSQNYNVWYLTGITDKDQVVFFSCRATVDVGTKLKIKGKVKSQRETSTQLSNVKIVKE